MGKKEIIGGVLLTVLGAGAAGMTQVGATMFPQHESLIFYLSCVAFFGSLILLLVFWPRKSDQISERPAIEVKEAGSITLSGNKVKRGPLLKGGVVGTLNASKNEVD